MTYYTARVADDLRLVLPQGAQRHLSPGQEIAIELVDVAAERNGTPNEAVLAMLSDLQQMKENMQESDPSNTDRIIREGRNGAMYGEPTN
jgi:hypothetical protein